MLLALGSFLQDLNFLEDVSSLLEILTVLKDVSSNRFFVFQGGKIQYQEFFDVFVSFFELLKSAESECPLLTNKHPGVDILVLTSELGFMSQLNSRVSSLALEEYNKNAVSRLICIGQKGAEKCRSVGMKIEKIFQLPVEGDRTKTDIEIRDYLVERITSGKTGKLVVAHVLAKSLGVLKPELVTLLPLSEVLKSLQNSDEFKLKKSENRKTNFIFETNLDSIK